MMDTSEYMPMFLAESREHLQALNLAVVRLEADPQDRPTVDEIFRIAHSLKGMSGTMGFDRVAEVTHEMESVFELLRQRTSGLDAEVIDTVFACLDVLSAAVEAIESTGQDELDPAPVIARLRRLVRPRTPDQEMVYGGVTPSDPLVIQAALAAGVRVLHLKVMLEADTMMPAVRAHMLLAALSDHGELVASAPTPDAIELFSGRQIDAWLASEHEDELIAATARGVSEVVSVEVDALTPVTAESTPPVSETPAKPASEKAARTVRVDAERLDALMHAMGELVIHRTAVEALTEKVEIPGMQQAMQELTRSSQALQAMVMQVRMIPVDVVFLRFPRLVRDLSSKLGKEVKLELLGTDTELDRTVVDALGDPLVHLVRNALDHGMESPEQRLAAGKPRVGKLQIAARHASGSVVIEVRDDGPGINPQAVARKALAIGLIDEETAADMDIRGAIELLFAPGFSTSEVANEVSGRGVGMDVVRTSIRELGGEVMIDSTPGAGTNAQIRLPLTLAIVSALQVDVAGAPFAIPLDRVERTLRLSQQTVRSVAGRRMLVLEDGVLPLLDGAKSFGRRPVGEHEFVVVVRAQERRLALAVDDLVGQRELVTRPLPSIVSDGQPVSAGAALADGQIALIVDCDALASEALGVGQIALVSSAPGAGVSQAPAQLAA
jgi:two-component system, chemotaxis family, sensor kinase CheA